MMTRDPAATVKMVKELDQQFRGNNKVASMIKDAFDDKVHKYNYCGAQKLWDDFNMSAVSYFNILAIFSIFWRN